MNTRSEIVRMILRKLKSTRGCSFLELKKALPIPYRELDEDPSSSVIFKLKKLVEWGLVEAHTQGKLIPFEEFATLEWLTGSPPWTPDLPPPLPRKPPAVKFFVSKRALDMELMFGFTFDGKATSVFGEPQHEYPWPDVFIVMPFAEDLKPVFEDHIKKVVMQVGLKVGRADDFFLHGSIISDVWSAINAAKIVIADCTGRNPNVFYEIGMAHSIGKDTILISKSIDDVPFDLRHLRVLVYEYTPKGMKVFEGALKKTINNLLTTAT